MPALSTNRIPAGPARSGTRGRPVRPRLTLGRCGINGSTNPTARHRPTTRQQIPSSPAAVIIFSLCKSKWAYVRLGGRGIGGRCCRRRATPESLPERYGDIRDPARCRGVHPPRAEALAAPPPSHPTGSGRTTTGADSFFVRCCNLFARSIYFRSAIYFHSFGSPANANGPSVLSRARTNYAIAGTE
jgi:hypothetical protein